MTGGMTIRALPSTTIWMPIYIGDHLSETMQRAEGAAGLPTGDRRFGRAVKPGRAGRVPV
jgi:hypothetical protein